LRAKSQRSGDAESRCRFLIGSFAKRMHETSGFAASHVGARAKSRRCPPSLLRQVLRVRCGVRLRRKCTYLAYGRSLVRNSPRGWAPTALMIHEVGWWESRCVVCGGRGCPDRVVRGRVGSCVRIRRKWLGGDVWVVSRALPWGMHRVGQRGARLTGYAQGEPP